MTGALFEEGCRFVTELAVNVVEVNSRDQLHFTEKLYRVSKGTYLLYNLHALRLIAENAETNPGAECGSTRHLLDYRNAIVILLCITPLLYC